MKIKKKPTAPTLKIFFETNLSPIVEKVAKVKDIKINGSAERNPVFVTSNLYTSEINIFFLNIHLIRYCLM